MTSGTACLQKGLPGGLLITIGALLFNTYNNTMAKLFGISGKATGRKGDTVFAVRNGQQLIRQYNPMVANPRSTDQVDARAKLKMMSQLSRILGLYLAIPRDGAKSPRNIFTKINYPLATATDGVAEIQLDAVQITNSRDGMIPFNATRNGASEVRVYLQASAVGVFDKVAYVAMAIDQDRNMRVISSEIVEVDVGQPTAATSLAVNGDAIVVYGYGIMLKSGKARVSYENIEGDAATHFAQLIATRSLGSGDVAVTMTAGASLAAL